MTNYNNEAEMLIEKLGLVQHPEGGWYKETYRSADVIGAAGLPERYEDARNLSTCIYYLLQNYDFSAFHRIRSDEIWHFYLGSPVKLYLLKDGVLDLIILGDNVDAGHVFQVVIPHGCWFAAEVSVPESFALLGCTVSPGFDFADMEIACLADLQPEYGRYATLIRRMTRS